MKSHLLCCLTGMKQSDSHLLEQCFVDCIFFFIHHRSKFVIENSYAACQDLTFGRMSFNGMNPEIEKLMRKLSGKPPLPVKEDQVLANERDADVKAEDVAESLSMTIARKFAKNNKNKPKRGYKRPAEDWWWNKHKNSLFTNLILQFIFQNFSVVVDGRIFFFLLQHRKMSLLNFQNEQVIQ